MGHKYLGKSPFWWWYHYVILNTFLVRDVNFWISLNVGWYSLEHDHYHNKGKSWSGDDVHYLSDQDFEALLKLLREPAQPNENLTDLMKRESPWN
jgi:hypothetical protein